MISKIIIPLVSFSFSPKFVKGVCLIKCIVTLIKFSLNISVDSNKVIPQHQCGFSKGHTTTSVWIPIKSHHLSQSSSYRRKIEKKFGQYWYRGMLLTDLSKAFDFLRHDLLIAKLAVYGLGQSSLCFIFSYLSDRTQRAKVNNAYSSYINIKYGVPQCSILGILLFNIDICCLFLWDYKCDIARYADENTPYTSGINLNLVLEKSGKIKRKINT